MEQSIRFAFALNANNQFAKRHFGDADKFLLVTWRDQEIVEELEIPNAFKSYDEEHEHGSGAKGKMISQMLREYRVQVIVSRQFGRNIRVVSQHFVPVVIYEAMPASVKTVLAKNLNWLADEINSTGEFYKLFIMKNGILKTKAKEID